jgi:hypothetical protein
MMGIRAMALVAIALTAGMAAAHAEPAARDKGLVTIFDNFAHNYPKALYLDLSGAEVRGGGELQAWWATPFTPDADHTVTRIEIPLSLYSGKDGLVLSLNSDASGLPGKALKSWNLKDLPAQGSCCVVKTANDAQGIPITGGQQYWVVVSADRKEGSTWANWLASAEDQVDTSKIAIYDSVYGWQPSTITPQLAFAVRGSK